MALNGNLTHKNWSIISKLIFFLAGPVLGAICVGMETSLLKTWSACRRWIRKNRLMWARREGRFSWEQEVSLESICCLLNPVEHSSDLSRNTSHKLSKLNLFSKNQGKNPQLPGVAVPPTLPSIAVIATGHGVGSWRYLILASICCVSVPQNQSQ